MNNALSSNILRYPPPSLTIKQNTLKLFMSRSVNLSSGEYRSPPQVQGNINQSTNQPTNQSINQSINQLSNSTGGLITSPLNHTKSTTNKFGHFDQFQTLAFVQSVNILCKLTKIYLSTVNRYQKKKYKSIFHTFCFNKS